jgi:hypothetical protein
MTVLTNSAPAIGARATIMKKIKLRSANIIA